MYQSGHVLAVRINVRRDSFKEERRRERREEAPTEI